MATNSGRVVVRAPARIHFGMLDLTGALDRRFGGIGAGLPSPAVELEASRAPALDASGPSAERAHAFARRFFEFHGLRVGARLLVRQAIPEHVGLGSGTQLALAVARALAELYELPTETSALARAVGRARRSAIGTWLFAGGGFVLEGGRTPSADRAAPLLARLPFPADWRCVLAIPAGQPGVSGEAESTAFAKLPPPAARDAEQVAHLVLMALLPALVDADIETFGRALTRIQCINGRWFAPVQGGERFAPGSSASTVERMTAWGAPGVGQSSWGPAVYAVVRGDDAAAALAAHLRDPSAPECAVFVGPFAAEGARVWWES